MTETEKKQLELFEKMVQSQHNVLKELKDLKRFFNPLIENLNKNNNVLNNTNEVIAGVSVIIDGSKDIFEDIAIYASNREELDDHLKESMRVLSETWNESITLFHEMRDVIQGIYKFAQIVTNERTRILSNMESDKYIGLNVLQEMFIDFSIEFISTFGFPPISQDEITTWMKRYFVQFTQDRSMDQTIQYNMFSEDIIEEVVSAFQKRFKMGIISHQILRLTFVIFQSFVIGSKITKHPMLIEILHKIKDGEDKIYE